MKREQKWVVPRTINIVDPRLALAKHIGWNRPVGNETEYSLPEPDDFNYAVYDDKPHDCMLIENQVFYKDKKSLGWWTLYYVPEELLQDFFTWANPIDFKICWIPQRPSKMRRRRPLLHTRMCAPEQTPYERLYTMGYYDELQNEFDIDITETLGKPRDNMPTGEFT
jgi:hypothetical protein